MAQQQGLGCCSQFAKIFLFLFNVIFWLVGLALFAVGIWALTFGKNSDLLHIATYDIDATLVQAAAITFVVIGLIVFITGFLGCCGAIKESSCMLMTYTVIVGVIIVLQLAAGIFAAVFNQEISNQLESSMNKTVQERYGYDESLSKQWDNMQQTLKCCGASEGPIEWRTSYWYTNETGDRKVGQTVPDSCCVLEAGSDYKNPVPLNSLKCYLFEVNYVYQEGCEPALKSWMKDNAIIIAGVAFGLLFFQILVILTACCLRKRINNLYEYV